MRKNLFLILGFHVPGGFAKTKLLKNVEILGLSGMLFDIQKPCHIV